MRLDDYLAERGMTRKKFAESLGVNPSTITRLCDGTRLPSFDLLSAIMAATRGKVGVGDFKPAKPNGTPAGQEPEAAQG